MHAPAGTRDGVGRDEAAERKQTLDPAGPRGRFPSPGLRGERAPKRKPPGRATLRLPRQNASLPLP